MKTDKLSNVEALRGLASLAVAWFHLTNQYDWNLVRWSGTYGFLGVDCFFVISGFIIPYSLHRAGYAIGEFPRFMARRLVRLEPPYLVAIALIIALGYASAWVPGFAGQAPHYTAPQVVSHLLYLAPAFDQEWINPVFWTLAYEFVFYISAGLLFPLLFKRSLWITAAVAALAAWLTPGKAAFLQPQVLLFLIGIAAMRYFVRRDRAPVFLTCAFAAAGVMAIEGQPAAAAVGLLTALILAFVRMSERRPLVFLGAISYSLYLTHVPIGGRVVNLGRRFGQGAAYDLALSLAALAVCLVFAWVFYKLIEAPATSLARRLSLRDRAAAPAAVGEAPDAA